MNRYFPSEPPSSRMLRLTKESKIEKTYFNISKPKRPGEALRYSTGQGGGLPWPGSDETSALLRSRFLKAEERLFLHASRLPPVRSHSSASPRAG